MNTVFKHLTSDPQFVSVYLVLVATVVALLLAFIVLSRYFVAKRELPVGVPAQEEERLHQTVRSPSASPKSPREAPRDPEETEFKVWWTACTQPASNVAFMVVEPELERAHSIEVRTTPQMRGEPIDLEFFPRKLVHIEKLSATELMSANGRRLPYFFHHNYFCITNEALDVFLDHDLGDAQFRDAEFYEFGGEVRVNERLKILVPCNPKVGFRLDDSPEVRNKSLGTPSLLLAPVASYQYRDGDIAVSTSVLDGPDVWIDPTFRRTFFLSDRLAQALIKSGLADDFALRWARVT